MRKTLAGPMLRAVIKSLRAADLAPKDEALAGLLRLYARRIDEDDARMEKLGPHVLAILDSLLLTPKARAALVKGVTDARGQEPANPIDELRAKRDARKNAS
jgi:hypothetical protein